MAKDDSLNYYMLTSIKGKEINTFIPKINVKDVHYASARIQKVIKLKGHY
jgi:hypothetical protein